MLLLLHGGGVEEDRATIAGRRCCCSTRADPDTRAEAGQMVIPRFDRWIWARWGRQPWICRERRYGAGGDTGFGWTRWGRRRRIRGGARVFSPACWDGMDGQDLNENEIVFRWELSLARFCPRTRSVWRHYALQIVYITRSACLSRALQVS
jgi:hypothetical protein